MLSTANRTRSQSQKSPGPGASAEAIRGAKRRSYFRFLGFRPILGSVKIEIAQQPSSAIIATAGSSVTRTGAVIEIAVIRDAITGNLLLKHGDTVYLPRPDLPLEEGERWRARVIQTHPHLILEIQDDRPHAMARRALRKHIASQRGMAPLLALLHAHERRQLEFDPDTRQRLDIIGAALPARSLLSGGQGLRSAARASGLWHEAHIAEGQPLQRDLKAALLKASRDLKPASVPVSPLNPAPPLPDAGIEPQPPAQVPQPHDSASLQAMLSAELSGVLARLTMSQAVTLLGGGTSYWHLEIPFRDRDGPRILQVRIDCEAGHDDVPVWHVGLALHSARLGGVSALATIHGDSVSITGHADRAAAGELLDRSQTILHQAVELLGAKLMRCTLNAAKPPAPTRMPASLLDIRA